MGSSGLGASGPGPGWRVLGGVPTAWFDASSLVDGAALAGRLVERLTGVVVDVRASGVRVRLDASDAAEVVSAVADELGLVADPAVLQSTSVVVESPEPSAVLPFWTRALGYRPGEGGALTDPWRRDPTMLVRRSTEARPLRNRIHVDVVRPAVAVGQALLGEASGPYGVRHVDADGNEIDLVPGSAMGDGPATADWQTVFGAVACYRTTSSAQQRDLVGTAARLADAAGFPLLVDVRPGLVVLDSGKDRWECGAYGLDLDFTALATDLQTAARELGAVADPGLPRFVQLVLDVADPAAARDFWAGALGYVDDPRPGVSDLLDPRALDPVLVMQGIDVTETERRAQRNRIHVELTVPSDVAPARLATALAAGGRLLEGSAERWLVVDTEGNELVIVAGA